MSEEKKTTPDKKKISFGEKLKNLWTKIKTPFVRMAQELKNVTWPTVDQLKTYCVIVLVFIAFMAIVIGFFDLGASTLVRAVRPS